MATWREELSLADALVMTPDVLKNALLHGYVKACVCGGGRGGIYHTILTHLPKSLPLSPSPPLPAVSWPPLPVGRRVPLFCPEFAPRNTRSVSPPPPPLPHSADGLRAYRFG